MNAIELKGTTTDGKEVYVHACGKCGLTAIDQEAAERCCRPTLCGCGAECEKGRTACKACRDSNRAAARKKAFEQATKIQAADYSGWLYCESADKFFESLDDLLEHYYDRDDIPTWAWACTEKRLSLDALELVSYQLECQEWFDGACDYIPGDLAELQAALDAVAAAIPPAQEVDYGRAVVFKAAAEAAARSRG